MGNSNVFLNGADRDIETAIMLEQAIVHDIGNAVAYTDGNRIFINTDDNLFKILPAYNHKMLKWLLWHERYHKELRHHNRFFKYLKEIEDAEAMDKFHISKNEVNIIMDILVHDSLAKLFPELVDTAVNNLAQMRNRNSLKYTFKTHTLEEMLQEYADSKDPDKQEDTGKGASDSEDKEEDTDEEEKDSEKKSDPTEKGHGESEHSGEPEDSESKSEDKDITDDPVGGATEPEPEPEHDKTDWSKLEKLDDKEFITKDESDEYIEQINELKRKKFRLGKLTETLNGLATSTRRRTYAMPSPIKVGGGVILKGSRPGYTKLALCFDGSGSMGREMETFKDIISKSIPQAMETPTWWFSGYCYDGSIKHCLDPQGRNPRDYYKGQFKDFLPVRADDGYSDDGDRTIELCWRAEQAGYCPIGVTDGGGGVYWDESIERLKQLKHTVFVGQNRSWLEKVHKINPNIQILDI